jgi:hypothetical protein
MAFIPMAFIPLEKALTRLSPTDKNKLERITEGVKDSSLVKVKVDIEKGSIRYLDRDSSSLLLEVEKALNIE